MPCTIAFTGRLVCSIGVKDHQASARWYAEHFNCSQLFENEKMGMTFMSSPVENVSLDISQVERVKSGGNAVLVWGVADVDAARKELESKGVRFDGATRTHEGMVKLATFFDPDGNTLMLYQSLSS